MHSLRTRLTQVERTLEQAEREPSGFVTREAR